MSADFSRPILPIIRPGSSHPGAPLLKTEVELARFFPYFLKLSDFSGRVMDTEIMTVREVSAYLKITEKTAYRLAGEGKIPGFKVGGAWRFRKKQIDEWIDKQMTDGWATE